MHKSVTRGEDVKKIFVGGRICLFGEHSDWPINYLKENKEIVSGSSIVTGLEQGITAEFKKNKNFIIKQDKLTFEIEMDSEKLFHYLKTNNYYSYCCSVAYYMQKKYDVNGLEVNIIEKTLPIRKGLSSSACISILIAEAFNRSYDLNLNIDEIMDIAYNSERLTGSDCGRMDQLCAYGIGLLYVKYGKKLQVKKIKVPKDLYLVFADLNGKKDTKKILRDLNSIYPIAKNKKEELAHEFLGKRNNEIIEEAMNYISEGNYLKLGRLMTKTQKEFDKKIAPFCMSELESPLLHKYLNDMTIKKYVYGGKGVGSQGDGSVQFIVRSADCQQKLLNILKEDGLTAFPLTIKADRQK